MSHEEQLELIKKIRDDRISSKKAVNRTAAKKATKRRSVENIFRGLPADVQAALLSDMEADGES
jgi:hypothetical protein